jgi:hypothetical protein
MTEQNNTKVIMNHNGTQSYQFQFFRYVYSLETNLKQSIEYIHEYLGKKVAYVI